MQGIIHGSIIGFIGGDTRSLDCSSCDRDPKSCSRECSTEGISQSPSTWVVASTARHSPSYRTCML